MRRRKRTAEDFDLEKYNRELRWEMAGGPYNAAMNSLRRLIVNWIEHPGSVKADLIQAWENLHPKERAALDREVQRVWSRLYGGGDTILYRKRDDRVSGGWGGASMTDRLEPDELRYYLIDPNRSPYIDEWGVEDELRAFRVGPDDVMLHWAMKDNPLGQGRWAWEREIVLAPGARVRELSRDELLDHLRSGEVRTSHRRGIPAAGSRRASSSRSRTATGIPEMWRRRL